MIRKTVKEKIVPLNSLVANPIQSEHGLGDLMASQSTALYVAWLLGQQQRRNYRHLASMSLDGRGRMAAMLLDFFRRLRRRRLISDLTYHMPIGQEHIGNYLSLTAVHVNRILKILQEERIARMERHNVTIQDLEQLVLLSGEHIPVVLPNEITDASPRDSVPSIPIMPGAPS